MDVTVIYYHTNREACLKRVNNKFNLELIELEMPVKLSSGDVQKAAGIWV